MEHRLEFWIISYIDRCWKSPWIFLKQRLCKRAHFLLFSLAIADLLVGLLSVPLYIAINTCSCRAQDQGHSFSQYGPT